ncbi:MAG TPA: MAPEG family protein [Candidatus Limnocylindrales bacterium]|nr:MAPEG family protein [Candidatus Limnocylindrales bacterium]
MTVPFDNQILYPSFAMFVLVAFVLAKLARLRVGGVGRGEVDVRFYKTYQEGEEPEHIRVVTRHFINLFEVPTLFHVIVILTYVTHHVSWWMIGCAWAYVAIRYAHTFVHLGSNDVLLRFRLYFASGFVLAVMWLTLFGTLLIHG